MRPHIRERMKRGPTVAFSSEASRWIFSFKNNDQGRIHQSISSKRSKERCVSIDGSSVDENKAINTHLVNALERDDRGWIHHDSHVRFHFTTVVYHLSFLKEKEEEKKEDNG